MIFNWFSLKARSKLCNYKTVLPGNTQPDEPILSSSRTAKVIIYVFLWVFHGNFSHLKLNHSRWQEHYWYRHLKLNFLAEFCGFVEKLILNSYSIITTRRGRWRSVKYQYMLLCYTLLSIVHGLHPTLKHKENKVA